MKSLGYLEVEGLSTAVVSADKMLKTADVELQGIENTKGGGWIMISITGDVAAVSVAIDAGSEAAADKVISSTVIANPAEGIDEIGKSDAILGQNVKDAQPTTEKTQKVTPAPKPVAPKTAPKPASSKATPSNKTTPKKPASQNNAKTKNNSNQKTDK